MITKLMLRARREMNTNFAANSESAAAVLSVQDFACSAINGKNANDKYFMMMVSPPFPLNIINLTGGRGFDSRDRTIISHSNSYKNVSIILPFALFA